MALAAVASGLLVMLTSGRIFITPSFVVVTLAAGLLGPVSAALATVPAELVAARRSRNTRWKAAMNLFAVAAPALVAGNLIRDLAPPHRSDVVFYLVVALGGVVYLVLNFGLAVLTDYLWGQRILTLRLFWEYSPSQALNIALAVAGVAIYVKVGLPGIVFALLALFSFSYMAYLLEESRQRAEKYVSLSWGVLAGLLRALDTRDKRAARHAAAVARFARDMAAALGMSERDQELAHTAGLLHDIGHFALSDRVHERGRELQDEDWMAIHEHPELGADMLRDLGMYGPVAEIVLAHHEQLNGLGYPYGLTDEEIPELAKIIAVAEVYDTLTAPDTYRTPVSSFEALLEMRRVAGTQLDSTYVEVLATLLSGEGVEYRHAGAADFDTELDMERRIKEARTG